VIAIARDTDADDGSCVMSQAKSNPGQLNVPSLRYVVETCEIPTEEGLAYTGKLMFTGESDRSVADILGESAGEGERRDERGRAAAWLVSTCHPGLSSASSTSSRCSSSQSSLGTTTIIHNGQSPRG